MYSCSVKPRWHSGKESICQCRICKRWGFDSWVGKVSWNRKWQPIPIPLPGKFQRGRSLVGHSPWLTKSQTWLSESCSQQNPHIIASFIAFLPSLSHFPYPICISWNLGNKLPVLKEMDSQIRLTQVRDCIHYHALLIASKIPANRERSEIPCGSPTSFFPQ